MPNPHFDVQIISRGAGRSAVAASSYRSGTKVATRIGAKSVIAAASYRSGQRLHDRQTDQTFDYTRKEDVLYEEIRLPETAPAWASDREALWNQVETVEKRKDAQLARDIIAALPRELDKMQQIALVQEFIDVNFTSQGMVADWALHAKVARDGGPNPHVHIMLTLREVDGDGFGKKNRDWNRLNLVSDWRESWANLTNRYLEEAGSAARLDLRSYEEQGVDRIPEQHMGYDSWNREKRGRETKTGDHNRWVHHENTLRDVAKLLYQPQSPEPEEMREKPPEIVGEAKNLREISRETPAGDDGAVSSASHLQAVARSLGEESADPARKKLEQAKEQFARAMLSRTVQATRALVERAASRARRWLDKTKDRLQDDAPGSAVFNRYANLRDLAKDQAKERDREHER